MLLVCHLFRADPPLSVHPPSKLLSGTALQSPCIWLTHSGLSPPSHPPLRYGLAATHELLARLQCVWISHIHADHHAGLVRVLAARRDVLRERAAPGRGACHPTAAAAAAASIPSLLVIGPRQLRGYLEVYERLEKLHCTFLDCSQTTREAEALSKAELHGNGSAVEGKAMGAVSSLAGGFPLDEGLDLRGRAQLGEVLSAMGLRSLQSVPVIHCDEAFAAVLQAEGEADGEKGEREGEGRGEGARGWKLVYSGDTRPCDALIEAARGATLLIHEVRCGMA